MIDTIEVTINNKKYKYSKNITLQEIYIEHQEHNKYPILIARVISFGISFFFLLLLLGLSLDSSLLSLLLLLSMDFSFSLL